MKKTLFSNFVLPSLVVLSLASYIFLSTAAGDTDLAQQNTSTELEDQEAKKVVLPDVTLAKKLINITKIVMPRD